MAFVADLHIHSYLSRATSKDLNLEGLHAGAQRKGITVVGTGDFTHPGWMAEIEEKLVPAEDGLFALRDDLAAGVDAGVPGACRGPVRFMLSVEVSSIYRRGDKVRKVHNLVYAPSFDVANAIAARLERIGNIRSDGRPILGIDSRDLLEIVLEASPDAFLVPAHVWTPWFSALGAQSGFDSIAECFGDLAEHVFAAETGLSSDPAMNWRLSALDRYALVSNSDAHSPEKLGREANLFDCDIGYLAIRDALRDRREGFLGTVEFFPEEGKYHLDGHRRCGVVLAPGEAVALAHTCPRCGKRLTGGVMGRVEALADRPPGFRPEGAKPYRSLVPLAELVGEVTGVGPGSARVRGACDRLLRRVGPELTVLAEAPLEALEREGPPLLAEAVRRMRAGDVKVQAGYDGEYGVVRAFDPDERRQLLAQTTFFFAAAPAPDAGAPAAGAAAPAARVPTLPRAGPGSDGGAGAALDPAQLAAVEHEEGPLLVVAGPGTGKTRTVAHRIARLVRRAGVSPRAITAITFTRKAAGELGERLAALLGRQAGAVATMTFHALGLSLLRAHAAAAGLPEGFTVLDDDQRRSLVELAVLETPGATPTPGEAARAIAREKAEARGPEQAAADVAPVYATYERLLAARAAVDFDDLVLRALRLLDASADAAEDARQRCRHLLVDEYQDVNLAQSRLVGLLATSGPGASLCAVGDPDQAIYGFRGADPAHFARFPQDHPGTRVVTLGRSYRSPAPIVRLATAVIERAAGRPPRPLEPLRSDGPPVERLLLPDERAEADAIAAEIERAVGGTSLESIASGRADGAVEAPLAFHDVAVLVRTAAQAAAIHEALGRAGIPFLPVREKETEVELEPQKVAVLTLHAAKGLEFPLVFVAGCEDGLLPLWLPGLPPTDPEEERRLLYVGITRARARLVLTAARRRTLMGRTIENRPCPFLADLDLPPDLLLERRAGVRARRAQQLSLI